MSEFVCVGVYKTPEELEQAEKKAIEIIVNAGINEDKVIYWLSQERNWSGEWFKTCEETRQEKIYDIIYEKEHICKMIKECLEREIKTDREEAMDYAISVVNLYLLTD